jgi:hypothetical protein
MGVLNRFLRRRSGTESPAPCSHAALGPRWDYPNDVGKLERATGFWCAGCGAVFSRDEGRELLAREGAAS